MLKNWHEEIVVCLGFTMKEHDGTFWIDGHVLYFNRDLGYLSVHIYQTYQNGDPFEGFEQDCCDLTHL